MTFDIELEITKANAEYFANCSAPAIDRESPLYQSLMRKNQTDYDAHQYDAEKYEQKRIVYTNHGNGPDWLMP